MEARRNMRGVGEGRAQMQAQTIATFFCEIIPVVVHNEIYAIEKELWERVKDA